MSVRDLWIAYFAVGGNGSLADVAGWLGGSADPNDRDHDLMAQALNDQFADRDLDHPMSYRSDSRQGRPADSRQDRPGDG